MAFIPVDKAVEGIMVYNLDGQKIVNTYWFKCTTAPSLTDLNQVLSILEDFWVTLSIVLSTEITFDHREAHDRTTSVGLVVESAITAEASGQVAGGTAPNAMALCVSHRTGYANRSARGRTFVGGIPRAYFTGNQAVATLVNGVQTAYEQLRDDSVTLSIPMCVASKYHDGAPRPLGVMTPITNFVINTQLDSQRRRMPGYGS